MASPIVVTGIFCGGIALAGVAFFVWEMHRFSEAKSRPKGFVSRAQCIRRLVGAIGVVIVAVLFFWGVNFFSPGNPLTFAIFWAAVALGALFLGILGILDIREVRRQFQDARREIFKAETGGFPGGSVASDGNEGHS